MIDVNLLIFNNIGIDSWSILRIGSENNKYTKWIFKTINMWMNSSLKFI